MHEYGVSIKTIWTTWTPRMLEAMSAKVSQRNAREQLERVTAASMSMIDMSKNPDAREYVANLRANANQYQQNTEKTGELTDEQKTAFNITKLETPE